MASAPAILNSIATSGALLSCALFIGWQRFVREPYALSLAGAFAMIAASFAFALAAYQWPLLAVESRMLQSASSITGMMLLVRGFRLRSALAAVPGWLLAIGVATMAAIVVVLLRPVYLLSLSVLLYAYGAVTSGLAAHALRAGAAVGRARGRPAFWMLLAFAGYAGLQAVLCLVEATVWPRVAPLRQFLFIAGMTTGITGIGLFALLLTVEDLAARLRRQALTDPLTGVLNRRGIEQAAALLVANARRTGWPLTVIVADLDRFKSINDRFGHAVGDAVLRRFAEQGREAMRAGDLVGRLGGEEFIFVLPASDAEQSRHAAERLRLSLGRAFADLSLPVAVTSSYGIAALLKGEALATLIERADEALYRAKLAGRDRIVVARPDADDDVQLELAWDGGGPGTGRGEVTSRR